jgi:predicted metalloenzyme YecM/ferredoxin
MIDLEHGQTFKHSLLTKLRAFAAPIIRELEAHHLREEIREIDHACYRVETLETYEIYKKAFAGFATLLTEAAVNGRPIATYKLAEPVRLTDDIAIPLIELPAPKPGKAYAEGFEHLEAVTAKPLKVFLQTNPGISAEHQFPSGLVKFHEQSLEDIIRQETEVINELKDTSTLKKVKITIKSPKGIETFAVRSGLGFQAICSAHKTPIEYDCRKADCGICAFRVLEGAEHLSPPTEPEKDFLKAIHADPDERFACQVRVFGDVTIEVDYL